MRLRVAIHAAVSFGASLLVVGCGDSIHVSNTSDAETGAMIDGLKTPGAYIPLNDAAFFTNGSTVYPGKVVAGANNEAFLFTVDRRPAHIPTPWTTGRDGFNVTFGNPIAIPVTIWIVRGPYADQVLHAQEAILRTTQIWRDERVGLAFGPITWNDATADPDATTVENFPNGDQGDAIGWAPLRTAIGFERGRLNIYWLNSVNGSATSGWSNFGAQIAMGRNTGDELLSHEIGHALSLTHVNGLAAFDRTNVMYSSSSTRAYMTEGQIVRAHVAPTSVLRALYTYPVVDMPSRSCGIGVASDVCPAIDRRLWADGTFPANN